MVDHHARGTTLRPTRLRRGRRLGVPSAWARSRFGRLMRRSGAAALIAAACMAALAAGLFLALEPAAPSPPRDRPLQETRVAPGAAPAENRPPGAAPGGERLLLEPPYDSQDGLTIVQGSYKIRLAGVEGPPGQAICTVADGRLWACGLQARAALHNIIAQSPLVCTLTGRAPPDLTLADCALDGEDLAAKLVASGWARPIRPDDVRFASERDLASAERRGLWDGGWAIRSGF